MSTEEHEHRVIGGYKATLHNPNTSEAAKANARSELDRLGVSYDNDGSSAPTKANNAVEDSKDRSHVIAGLRGTLKNKHNSEEAKEHARERLRELGVDPEAGSPTTTTTELPDTNNHADSVHDHRVIGGMKASIHNPNVSEEKKQELREKLEDIGVDPEEKM